MSTRNPCRKILYCSKGILHPTILARYFLKGFLLEIKYCEVITRSNIKFRKLIQRDQPDLIVLYFHEKTIRPDDLLALEEFVSNGGSILAVHSASASFKQDPTYHKLLGGRFIEHGPISTYEIKPSSYVEESFCTLSGLFSIKDELYIHEYDPHVHVLLETQLDGRLEPVAWIKKHGKGNVAYFAPGHRALVFGIEIIRHVIGELIEWGFANE